MLYYNDTTFRPVLQLLFPPFTLKPPRLCFLLKKTPPEYKILFAPRIAARSTGGRLMKKRVIVTLSLASVAAICIGLLFLSRLVPDFVTNVYTRGIFKYISLPFKWLVNFLPFSFGEVLLIGLVILLPVFLIVSVVFCFRLRSGKPLAKYGMWVSWIASVAVIFYVLLGGFNYNARTFAERNGYDIRESTVAELMDLCEYLNDKAAECRNLLEKDENGVVKTDMTVYEMIDKASDGYDALTGRFPEFGGFYARPKPAINSTLMCYFQISGIYPYIVPEAIVNADTPVSQLPHTICHEMAHQRGVAREDEANYVAYLAAINNPDPLFRYSGYMEALSYSLNALYSVSSTAGNQVRAKINVGIMRDWSAASKFWKSFEQKNELPAKITSSVNNTYLQIQNIPDGTQSYGRMVDLLLAEFRMENQLK